MKIRFRKIKYSLKSILGKFSRNLWLVMIFLLALDFGLGAFFFWKYCLKGAETTSLLPPLLKINQGLVEEISEEWSAREKIFEDAANKEYLDVFRTLLTSSE